MRKMRTSPHQIISTDVIATWRKRREITVTEAAQKEVLTLKENQETTIIGVRVKAEAISPLQANFRLAFVGEGQEEEGDEIRLAQDSTGRSNQSSGAANCTVCQRKMHLQPPPAPFC